MAETASAVLPAETASTITKPDWWPNWQGETVAIVASGPTAKQAGVEQLKDKVRVIAINESYQLCPWADALYGCDGNWWLYKHGVPNFTGLKVAAKAVPPRGYEPEPWRAFPEIKYVTIDRYVNALGLSPGRVGSGGNSGFQAFNLAVQLGVNRILLIGFDMRVDLGEHWHPRHYPPMSNPHPNDNLPRWRKAFDGAADCLEKLGIEVINCSPVSLLKAYPKMTIAEALA